MQTLAAGLLHRMQPAMKAAVPACWCERECRRFERAHHTYALLPQPRGGIPHPRVEIALGQVHRDLSLDPVSAVDGRE